MAAPKTYYDLLSNFDAGMDSGREPLLLPKNALASLVNGTVRGAFISPRSPYQRVTLNYNGDEDLQIAVERGFFQGAGSYRPDFGASQIIAQITGRLYSFTEVGEVWTVRDITIEEDANDAGTNQVWMWQSEKWLIISDGTEKLPIFYDGATCRRSLGLSRILATTAAPFTPPAIGSTVDLTLTAPYTGPYNTTVNLNGAYYQPIGTGTLLPTYSVILTNLHATVGATEPTGSFLLTNPSLIGFVTGGNLLVTNSNGSLISLSSNKGLVVGDKIVVSCTVTRTFTPFLQVAGQPASSTTTVKTENIVFRVQFVDALNQLLLVPDTGLEFGESILITNDALVKKSNNTQPVVIIGKVASAFVNPARGGTVAVTLTAPYTGPSGQVAWLGLNQQYSIAPVPPPTSTVTLTVINVSDTTNAPVANPVDLTSVAELPACRMGAYGMGRNCVSLTDGISFMFGDIVGGSAGSPAENYRDAVLKVTENSFLNGGGTFRLPGSGTIINSMTFSANLDASLGQGPLQIGTDSSIFTCIVPVDRTTWNSITNPILTESLIGFGPLAQNSTILANSDTLFRSVEGLGSLILARRDFTTWGNTPISREVDRVLRKDNRSLLAYGSSITFDNRLLTTANPNVAGQGVYHRGTIAMNFDPLSGLRGKAPSVYDGLWTGLNVLQYLKGMFNGVERSFAFSLNAETSTVELYELLHSSTEQIYDNGVTRIEMAFETPVVFNRDVKPLEDLIRLENGEIYLQDIQGTVDIQVLYKPDFYPCYVPWHSFQVCADTSIENGKPGYRTRIGLGTPNPTICEVGNNRQANVGHFFQIRVVCTGHCRVMAMRFAASQVPEPDFAPPICCEVTNE